MITGLRQTVPQPMEQVDFMLLGGTRRRAMKVTAAGGLRFLLTALPHAEGERILMCREPAGAESKCRVRLEAASRWGWRVGPPASVARAPARAGRTRYAVPEGCDNTEAAAGGT